MKFSTFKMVVARSRFDRRPRIPSDSITTLEEYGLISKMLHFLKQEGNMLSVNKFRLVIKICWIVESVNGLIKTWKMLANVFSNTQIPYIGDVRIVSALCNAYHLEFK